MITIYTTSSCSSCRKAKKWMEEYQIPYKEINLFVRQLKRDELLAILERTENGMEDIVSNRSKAMQEVKVDFESLTMNDAVEFLLEHPSAIKRPIIMDERHFQVGYNEDEIRAFIPKELRERYCEFCKDKDDCPIHKIRSKSQDESTNNI